MYILRAGNKIELTAEELESAYREQERSHRLNDALIHLASYFDIDHEDPESDPGALQAFEDVFGFSYSEAINDSSENYILDDLREMFMDWFDCNHSENNIWDNLIGVFIRDYLPEVGSPETPSNHRSLEEQMQDAAKIANDKAISREQTAPRR